MVAIATAKTGTASSTGAGTRSARRGKSSSRSRNRPSPRERLLAAATELFTSEGIRVIGIDRILRQADVAKASLYSLFGSKDALVTAYVKKLDEDARAAWLARTQDMTNPKDKVLAFFDEAIAQQPARDYRGSHFQNAANEYPRPENDAERGIVEAVRDHRNWLLTTLTQQLTKLYGYSGMAQAKQLVIFLDGGLAAARLDRSTEPLITARILAKQLLETPPADYSI